MMEQEREAFTRYLSSIAPTAEAVFMDPKRVVFEECVKMNCYYCGRYGRNWRCPPNLPDLDWPKMFSEFDEGAFVAYSYELKDGGSFDSIRSESSIVLHKTLLKLEQWMYDHNKSTAVSFGAGSCKLCRGGCGQDRCNNPYMSRSPLEATGVNVLKTAALFGLDISFPPKEKLMRVGLIVWQD